MTFTIEQLKEMRSKITSGDRYLHEDDWGDLCVVNDDGRYMTWGDQLVVKIEAGHMKHDGESIVAIPALLDQLIAREADLQQLKVQIEDLASWHSAKAAKARDFPWIHGQHEARFRGKAEAHEVARNKLVQILEETND